MKVIIQHDANRYRHLKKYSGAVYYLSETYKIVDVKKSYVTTLKTRMQYVEPDFEIELCETGEVDEEILNSNRLLITIGALSKDSRIDAEYNMATHTLKKRNKKDKSEYRWIHCYDFDNKTDAAKYIQCIRFLYHCMKDYCKPVIIYSSIYVYDERFRYRSLTYKIINEYLEKLKALLIVKAEKTDLYKHYESSNQNFEYYIDRAIYLDGSLNDAVKKVIPLLNSLNNRYKDKSAGKKFRQSGLLYEDNMFYKSLNPEEEIYVLLDIGNFRSPEKYTRLGFKHVPLIGSYGMLYGKKKAFDELRDELRYDVTYPYYIPIVSHPKCDKSDIKLDFSYQVCPTQLKYQGKDVYIGVVCVDGVDYTHKALQTPDGKTRIAYIWDQKSADEGTSYYKEDIDNALASDNPGGYIHLPQGESISTMILGLAGGYCTSPNYQGIATESEFLVAKIKPASEGFQRIYGGMPGKYVATLADVLVGVLKLITFAAQEKKPLVLCIPFNTNLDPHDGTVPLYFVLQILATRAGVAMIVPAGDEADKMHHCNIKPSESGKTTVNIIVERPNQNVVGTIYQNFPNMQDILLYPPGNISTRGISLKYLDITELDGAIIYNSGYKISPLNGSVRMLFRIENPHQGTWRIECIMDPERVSQTNLWISQKELNEYIKLSPSDAFMTIGSTACLNTLITVGGYDQEHIVPLSSSGIGYIRINMVKPDFLTNSSNIIAPCSKNEWAALTGTVPAASIITGAVATLFNKYAAENIFPLPNSLVIKSILFTQTFGIGDITYPNPIYGYGIFDLAVLDKLQSQEAGVITGLS